MENRNWKETDLGRIPYNWDIRPIGQIGDVTKLAGFEYTKYITYVDDGEVIALRALNVRDGNLDLSDVKRIYKNVSDSLERSKLYKDDILFTYVGANIGQFALVPENEKFHLAPNICRIRCKSLLHPYFLYSYLRTDNFKASLDGFSHGSSQPTMPMGSIRQISIPVPPLPEQKAIASVLSSLDDKIDLLHQQNQTLEALAETLFRQWFVEEAKEDWEDCTIGDLANHSKISVHPNKNPDTLYHHYSIPAFDANKKPIVELGKEIKSNKYKVEENSILFSKLNPHKDKRVWLIQDSVEEHAICSTELQVVKPKDDDYLYFIYGWLTNSIYYNEIASGVGGTSGSHQRIDPKTIFSAPSVRIDKNIILQYNIHAEPLFRKQFVNQQQIQTLTKLRDTLLPKLMSGEVRVK